MLVAASSKQSGRPSGSADSPAPSILRASTRASPSQVRRTSRRGVLCLAAVGNFQLVHAIFQDSSGGAQNLGGPGLVEFGLVQGFLDQVRMDFVRIEVIEKPESTVMCSEYPDRPAMVKDLVTFDFYY